jgi:hypothetical protein
MALVCQDAATSRHSNFSALQAAPIKINLILMYQNIFTETRKNRSGVTPRLKTK